jgi:hypothetical protein
MNMTVIESCPYLLCGSGSLIGLTGCRARGFNQVCLRGVRREEAENTRGSTTILGAFRPIPFFFTMGSRCPFFPCVHCKQALCCWFEKDKYH